MGGYFCISHLFSSVIFGLCVPVFFFISGFLFFKKGFDNHVYINKLYKRTRTILVPFICWNLLYLLIFIFCSYIILYSYDGSPIGIVPWLNGNEGSMIGVIGHWLKGTFINFNGSGSPTCIPFWYLRDLICMFIFSPLFFIFIKHMRQYGLAILILIWLLSGRYTTFPYLFIRPHVLFYLMGAYFAINKYNLVNVFSKIGNWLYFLYAFVAFVDLLTSTSDLNCFIHRATILLGVVASFKIAIVHVEKKRFPEKEFAIRVKNTNFFIFAVHWIILYWLSFPLTKLYDGTDFH